MKLKNTVLFFILCLPFISMAQQPTTAIDEQRGIYVGVGLHGDFFVPFSETNKYVKSTKTTTASILSAEAFSRIKLDAKYNIYPTIRYSLLTEPVDVKNTDGTHIPEGQEVQLPKSSDLSSTHYSPKHIYQLSECTIGQASIGGYITRNVGKYFEIGTGAFLNMKIQTITDKDAIDEYYWKSTTTTDNYSYNNTVFVLQNTSHKYTSYNFTVPLLVQYTYTTRSYHIGTGLVLNVGKTLYAGVKVSFALAAN